MTDRVMYSNRLSLSLNSLHSSLSR